MSWQWVTISLLQFVDSFETVMVWGTEGICNVLLPRCIGNLEFVYVDLSLLVQT